MDLEQLLLLHLSHLKVLVESLHWDTIFCYRPENPSPIVLYGSKEAGCVQHMEWLARKLEKLQKDRKAIAKVESDDVKYSHTDEEFDPFEYFCHTIADRVHEIWILEGDYHVFCSKYGFLCGHVSFESMFPLPHQINPNVFLGSRVIPLTKECLSKLGITHMILSTYQSLDWHELEGISILRCDVHDKNKQDMIPCWKACVAFMAEALSPSKQVLEANKLVADFDRLQVTERGDELDKETTVPPVRILVILHGRSRSTSVVLAYLIKTLRIGFEEAWSFVRKNCWHLIDRSLVYEDQLKEWEKAETRSICGNTS